MYYNRSMLVYRDYYVALPAYYEKNGYCNMSVEQHTTSRNMSVEQHTTKIKNQRNYLKNKHLYILHYKAQYNN